MSSKAPENAATIPQRRTTEIRIPQCAVSCPDCARRQELMLQMAIIADSKSKEAEAYQKLYEALLLEIPTTSKAA